MAPYRQGLGRAAEAHVVDWLEARGFVVLWQNLRLGHLEIDLVAQRGDLVVVVEVRTRGASAYEGALASMAGKKRMHLVRAAERLWRTRLARRCDVARVRIDVAAVHLEGDDARVEYFAGAIVA